MVGDSENCRAMAAVEDLLNGNKTLLQTLYAQSGAPSWDVSQEDFLAALARSVEKHFRGSAATPTKIEDYLRTLHLQDLALACACSCGQSRAWEHFVSTYRNYLRVAAGVIVRCPAGSPAACDLADSLFADLYGLSQGKPSQRSLFRYFHGRSSLKTWLRAVVSQRHIDAIRAGHRFAEWEDGEELDGKPPRHALQTSAGQAPDPHRDRYVQLFAKALEAALTLLDPRDKERLRLYYAEEQTLAQIGRTMGEHESSASRHLERTRQELRAAVEKILRQPAPKDGLPPQRGLSDEEISLCFEYASDGAPINFDNLFPQPAQQVPDQPAANALGTTRKESASQRSKLRDSHGA